MGYRHRERERETRISLENQRNVDLVNDSNSLWILKLSDIDLESTSLAYITELHKRVDDLWILKIDTEILYPSRISNEQQSINYLN